MTNILITVDDQDLVCTGRPIVASQGVNEDSVVFTFSSHWDGFGKTAYFFKQKDKDTVYVSAVDAGGAALVPWEVMDEDGVIYIGVYGVKDDVIRTSDMLRYEIRAGLYTVGEQSQPPTPGIYEQILTLIGAAQDYIDSQIDDVNAALALEGATRASADNSLSGRIDANGARIDNIIRAFNTDGEEETLYIGTARFPTTSYTLSDSVSNYDYLDIYLQSDNSGREEIRTIPVDPGTKYVVDAVNIPAFTNAATSHPFIQVTEIEFSVTGTSLSIYNHTWFSYYTDPDGTAATISTYGQVKPTSTDAIKASAFYIKKVVGRKNVENTELSDIREGYDGTEYETAGAAVRAQISDLHDELDAKITVSGTSLIIKI